MKAADDEGTDIPSIERRLGLLVDHEDWGLELTQFRYSNLNDYCLLQPDGSEVPNPNNDPELHQYQLTFGYGGDSALQNYDVVFHGVVDGARCAEAFDHHDHLYSGHDVERLLFTNGKNRPYRFELALASNRLHSGERTQVGMGQLQFNIEFSCLSWYQNDVLIRNPPTDPRDIPPG